MEIDTIIQLINSVGFPIFVSVYLLFTTNKLLTENSKMLSELKEEIQKMNAK
jgi:hypothetical protein